jgi:eukaryotic-like serine/threonine-protein kinase
MLCVHCSTPVADEANFCHSCGSMVSDAEGQAAATAAMDMSAFAHLERMLREEIKGEFVLGDMLGRGGMAVVYLAEETKLGRKVALKVLPPELTFGHGVDRFLREAKTAAALDHPHIIPIYRISAEGKLFWYAMKYLEGKSLEDVLRERGTFSLEETITILEQVADALDYAHDHAVIHRDIKPANVMLDHRNRVIITDFGIAKALSEGALTASGSVIGTPYFMSPEQGMGKPVSGASDQYSVGVMAFRMLGGKVPYDGDSAIDILHKHCMMAIPRLDEIAPHVPAHVANAIEKTMAKKAPERFPNITAFVAALKNPNLKVTRPSATLLIDSGELAKVNSGPRPKAAGRTASPAAETVVASPAAGVKRVPAKPVAQPKGKAGLWAAVALVVAVGGGFGAWKLMTPSAPVSATVLENTPPAGGAAGVGAESPEVAGAVAGTAVQDAAASAPQVASAAPQPTSTATQVVPPTAPVRQAPAQTQPQSPPRTTTPPASPAAGAPASGTPAPAAAASPTLLFLTVPTPGFVSVNGVSEGERRNFRTALRPGEHVVRVEREGFVTIDTTLIARGGDTLRVTLTLVERP